MSEIVKVPNQVSEADHFALVVKQADVLAQSSIVPKAYRGKSADIIAAGLAGRAFNWDVMTSMRNYHVIEGAASLRPEAMLGLVRVAGHSVTFRNEDDAVTAIGTRSDTGDTYESRFSVADAQQAGLATKRNWKQYPDAMLTWRAVSKLCRYLFPDVVLGAGMVPEELDANVNADGEIEEATIETTANATEIIQLVSPVEAKNTLMEHCGGDTDLAKEIWGDLGSQSIPQETLFTLLELAKSVMADESQEEEIELDEESKELKNREEEAELVSVDSVTELFPGSEEVEDPF